MLWIRKRVYLETWISVHSAFRGHVSKRKKKETQRKDKEKKSDTEWKYSGKGDGERERKIDRVRMNERRIKRRK